MPAAPDPHRLGLAELYAERGGLVAIFGPKVADYVSSRPDYPSALFDWLEAQGALHAGSRVADLGAGTGLLTRDLLARGAEVLAVEPNAAMREACDRLLAGTPGYRSTEGRAESIPAPDASLDLVTAAQAFHWFDIPAARRECARVLAPGGAVALIWNDRLDGDPLHADMSAVFERFGGKHREAMLAHENPGGVAAFFAPQTALHWSGEHEHRLGEAGLLALAFSRSYMPASEAPERAAAAAALREVFARHAVAAAVTVRYCCVCWLGRLA
jgi:SAM-dependent methyltransferase